MFTNGPGDQGSILGRVIPKTQNMVLDAALLNTQHYKVQIKGSVEQSRKRSSAPSLHFDVVAIEKGAYRSPSATVANFTLLTISMQFSSISPINMTLSGVTTPGLSGLGSDGNEGVLHIPQSSRITGTSPSVCLVSYQDTHWGDLTPLQRCRLYSTTPANWANKCMCLCVCVRVCL